MSPEVLTLTGTVEGSGGQQVVFISSTLSGCRGSPAHCWPILFLELDWRHLNTDNTADSSVSIHEIKFLVLNEQVRYETCF